jgi:hypothetical protein
VCRFTVATNAVIKVKNVETRYEKSEPLTFKRNVSQVEKGFFSVFAFGWVLVTLIAPGEAETETSCCHSKTYFSMNGDHRKRPLSQAGIQNDLNHLQPELSRST